MAVGLRGGRRLLLARGAALGGVLALSAGCAGVPHPNTEPADRAPATPLSAQTHAQRSGTLIRLGDAARRSGDWGAAASLYQQAVAVDPANPRGHLALGEALLEAGAPAEAARAFEEALRLAPGERAAAHGHARAMIALDRPERAIERYAALVEADPKDLRAANGLGVAYDLAGRHGEAQAAYREGLARDPDDLALRNNLGLSLTLAKRPEEAIPILRRVAESSRATARNRQNLALAYGLAGDLASAERVARIDLDDEEVRSNLAVYEELRARDGAIGRGAAPPPVGVAPAPAAVPGPPRRGERERRATGNPAAPAVTATGPTPPPEALAPKPIVIKLDAQLPPPPAAAVAQPAAGARRPGTVAAAGAEPGPPRPAVGAATPPAVAAPGPERRPGAAVAVDGGADLLLGAALGGSWFLELGEYPDGPEALAAWRELRRRYPAALAGLNRLAGIDGAPQSLVVGPVGSGAAARELCLRLKGDGATCRPVLL